MILPNFTGPWTQSKIPWKIPGTCIASVMLVPCHGFISFIPHMIRPIKNTILFVPEVYFLKLKMETWRVDTKKKKNPEFSIFGEILKIKKFGAAILKWGGRDDNLQINLMWPYVNFGPCFSKLRSLRSSRLWMTVGYSR